EAYTSEIPHPISEIDIFRTLCTRLIHESLNHERVDLILEMEKQIQYHSLEQLPEVAAQIVAFGKSELVWLFEGQMGAGKTTLIKALCAHLGVTNHVQSPTFSIVNEYITEKNDTLYHFDFYRLKNEVEAMDMGIEEYFDSGNFCFVEWPSKIENLWPANYLSVEISVQADGSRLIILKKN
uniref:tRNA (adenosine(37)-N6)-threonylcarbamoyltransferase complex ATPase subunit type 1 TsaE n=1 Tax=Flectobacillus sp. TaxID=50419 RepID=UPI003B9D3677